MIFSRHTGQVKLLRWASGRTQKFMREGEKRMEKKKRVLLSMGFEREPRGGGKKKKSGPLLFAPFITTTAITPFRSASTVRVSPKMNGANDRPGRQ